MSYDPASDMITWELYFIEKDRRQVFAYPSSDMRTAIGIAADIEEKDWVDFCSKMINKEFNLAMPIEEARDVE
jgi:hypothetical protein